MFVFNAHEPLALAIGLLLTLVFVASVLLTEPR